MYKLAQDILRRHASIFLFIRHAGPLSHNGGYAGVSVQRGWGEVLCYRTRLLGPVDRLVSLGVGVVQASPGSLLGRRAAVTIRYTLPNESRVQVHRGWLYTEFPCGTRLQVIGFQAEGPEVLLSLRPVRAGAERSGTVASRIRLPFQFQSWGVRVLRAASFRLKLACRTGFEGLLMHGWLSLILQTDSSPLHLRIPFCRLLRGEKGSDLQWRCYGGVLGFRTWVHEGGTIEGEALIEIQASGISPQPAPLTEPAVALWREISAEVTGITAEVIRPDKALVSGRVNLDLYWSDRSGRSRWTGRTVPLSAMLELPGLREGDRLEPVARVERLLRVGEGDTARASLLAAVGLTALRSSFRRVEGALCRLEEVVGQAFTSVAMDEPLRQPPTVELPLRDGRPRNLSFPGAGREGWESIELDLGPVVRVDGGWQCSVRCTAPERYAMTTGGSLPHPNAAPPLLSLRSLDSEGIGLEVIRWGATGPLASAPSARTGNATLVDVGEPITGLFGVAWKQEELSLLIRPRGSGQRLLAVPAPARLEPLGDLAAVTAVGAGDEGEGPRQVLVTMEWEA